MRMAALVQQQQPQVGLDGQPAAMPEQGRMQQQPQQQPPMQPLMTAQMVAQEALKLLKDDRLRTFRVDIETDSIILEDEQLQKQSRVEFLTATSNFLQQAVAALEKFPKMAPLLGEMLMFGIHGFRVGTQLENVFEAAINDIEGLQPMGQQEGAAAENGKLIIESKKLEATVKNNQDTLALESQRFQAEEVHRQVERTVAAQTFQAEEAQRAREHEIKMKELELQSSSLVLQLKKLDLDLQNAERGHQLKREKLDNDKQARVDERSNAIEDRRLDGKITPTIEEEVQEVRLVIVPLVEVITKMGAALDAITNRIDNNHSDMVSALIAPKRLIRDQSGRISGSETVHNNG